MKRPAFVVVGTLVAIGGCSTMGQYSQETTSVIERCDQAAQAQGYVVHSVCDASSYSDGSARVSLEASSSDGGASYTLTCSEDATGGISIVRSDG